MNRTRRPQLLVLLVASVLLVGLTACPGASPIKPSPTTKKDTGGVIPVEQRDGGSVLPPATTDGAPTSGTMTCAQIASCYDSCTDDACGENCFNQGSADGQAKMGALEQCWAQADAGTCKTQCTSQSQACMDCEDQACAAQTTACGITSTPTTPPTTGTMTCAQIAACYDACTNDTCYDTCFNQGSADGQAKMDAVEKCWSTAETGSCKTQCANPQSQGCYSCEDQVCAAQMQACGM